MSDVAAAVHRKYPGLYSVSVAADGAVALRKLAAETADLSQAEIDAAVLEHAVAAKKAEIDAERERRVYLPIWEIDVRGDGTLLVEPDIRNAEDRANLVALHAKALSLQAQGVTAAVMSFGAADNVEYMLTPAEMVALAEAPFDRASALYVRARAKKDAVDAMASSSPPATVDDIEAVDVVSGWS